MAISPLQQLFTMSMYTLSPDLGLLGLLLPLLLSDVLLCPLLGGPPLASWLATLCSFLGKSVLIFHIFDYYKAYLV